MVGHMPLEHGILVRVQVRQLVFCFASFYILSYITVLYVWKHRLALLVNVVLLGVSNHFLFVIHILSLYV